MKSRKKIGNNKELKSLIMEDSVTYSLNIHNHKDEITNHDFVSIPIKRQISHPKNKLISPFLKWVGGKRQIMSSIVEHLPKNISKYNYIEPFIGGGAVLFHI
jgi:hypothetical protein